MMGSSRRRSYLAIALAATMVAAACAGGASPTPGGGSPGTSPGGGATIPPAGAGEVSVIGTWGGKEQDAFLAMVKPWEDRTGNKVKFTGTRDINAVLATGVASGILPDAAGLPGPGQMAEFARAGALKPLDGVLDMATYNAEVVPAVSELGIVDGQTYGVFIKNAVKGPIWFNKANFTGTPPATFDELQQVPVNAPTMRWCVGLEAEAASGWPGTDWIEDIILRQSGPEVYDAWVRGEQKWSSPEIKQAWESFGDVLDNAFGGPQAIVADGPTGDFRTAGNALFTDPPGCLFHHQANFITANFVEGGASADEFDFFLMPDINPQYAGSITGGGDLFGLFSDKPEAQDLIKYLVTAEAQQIWVDIGGAISANTKVTKYPDEITGRLAQNLLEAKTFRFDGSDLMPEAMNNAFWSAILEFALDQSKLDSILANLDEVQESAYAQ
jgi:alpha-glucoside transport system substrate-binding protein